jgi:hypothetical protein
LDRYSEAAAGLPLPCGTGLMPKRDKIAGLLMPPVSSQTPHGTRTDPDDGYFRSLAMPLNPMDGIVDWEGTYNM